MDNERDAREWYDGLTPGTKRDLRATAPECQLPRDLGVAAGAGARLASKATGQTQESAPPPEWQDRYELWPWARFVVVESAFNSCFETTAGGATEVATPGYVTRRYELLREALARLGQDLGKGSLIQPDTENVVAEWSAATSTGH